MMQIEKVFVSGWEEYRDSELDEEELGEIALEVRSNPHAIEDAARRAWESARWTMLLVTEVGSETFTIKCSCGEAHAVRVDDEARKWGADWSCGYSDEEGDYGCGMSYARWEGDTLQIFGQLLRVGGRIFSHRGVPITIHAETMEMTET